MCKGYARRVSKSTDFLHFLSNGWQKPFICSIPMCSNPIYLVSLNYVKSQQVFPIYIECLMEGFLPKIGFFTSFCQNGWQKPLILFWFYHWFLAPLAKLVNPAGNLFKFISCFKYLREWMKTIFIELQVCMVLTDHV